MLKLLRKFRRDNKGLAAIEFAMLAPVMAAMFLGSIELCDALNCQQKVTGMASTAADLVAQETVMKNADISNVFSAMNAIVYPYPTTNLRIVITSLVDNGRGGATVQWSDAQNATARSVGATVTVPTGVITSGGTVIMCEVTYPFTSAVNDYITGTPNMSEVFYERPRRTSAITRQNS
ncbi:MAG TPA: TadE/TadG family type IV pilus assembly protein [Rhizomicrobium sp.]|jgi:Flp pilus assembly protein TadG|nr:TadE/TadG family type IV pilus assembly protein [Rhizomicrobium sp.]